MNSGYKIKLTCFSISTILFFVANILFAQEPFFINFQQRDGLPSSLAYSIFQDSKGYIWISSDLGVSRFDGEQFQNFTIKDGLADNEIFNFFEDTQGRLWFRSLNGQLSYYHNKKFYNTSNTPHLKKASLKNYLNTICEDNLGNLYFTSASNQGSILSTSNQFTSFALDIKQNIIQHMWVTEKSEILTATNDGIYPIAEKENSILFSDFDKVYRTGVIRAWEDDSYVVMGKSKDLIFYDKISATIDKIITISEINTVIIHLSKVGNAFWVGTRDGLFKIVFSDNSSSKYSIKKYFEGLSVTSTLHDTEGNLWCSTLESGIFFSPIPDSDHLTQKNGLPDKNIFTLSQSDDGKMWMGYNKNQYSILSEGKLEVKKFSGLIEQEVERIKHFEPNEHWILGQGVIVIHDSKKLKYLFTHTHDLEKDEYGCVWLGQSRLLRFWPDEIQELFITQQDKDFDKKRRSPPDFVNTKEAIAVQLFTALESNLNGIFWAGTTNGLFRYNYDSLTTTGQYKYPDIKGKIVELTYDPTHDWTWAATNAEGIYLLQGDTTILILDEKTGLSDNSITNIYLDDLSHLWVCTPKGVDKVTLGFNQKVIIENFSQAHGLVNIRVNEMFLKDDLVHLGTENGLIILPLEANNKKTAPPVYFSNVQVKGKAINFSKDKVYTYDQNAFDFSFEGLSFRNAGKLQYQYRLIGEEQGWSQTVETTVKY